MASNKPVKICTVRASPSKDPKFHQVDRLEGAGRSDSILSTFFNRWYRLWFDTMRW